MRKILLFFFLIFFAFGQCFAVTHEARISTLEAKTASPEAAPKPSQPDEATLKREAQSFPTEFTVSANEAGIAWGRAQGWLGRYSSMKLQIINDFILQTYNPQNNSYNYGYTVTKSPNDDGSFQIKVECYAGNALCILLGNTNRNASMLAYYMKTGKNFPDLIVK